MQNSVCILGLVQLVDGAHYGRLKQTFQLARQLEVNSVNYILYLVIHVVMNVIGICSKHSLHLPSVD